MWEDINMEPKVVGINTGALKEQLDCSTTVFTQLDWIKDQGVSQTSFTYVLSRGIVSQFHKYTLLDVFRKFESNFFRCMRFTHQLSQCIYSANSSSFYKGKFLLNI